MTAKRACGECGSASGCGCGTPNPYERSKEVVWHDPTSYSMPAHGPSFMPKLGSSQRVQVRSFVRRQAAFSHPGFEGAPLSMVVQFMRALAFIHQTHHWQTSGPSFYADHQLFERIYDQSLEFIDQLAERAVGTEGPMVMDALLQAGGVLHIVAFICGHAKGAPQASSLEVTTPDQMVQRSLRGEAAFLQLCATLLKTSQALSPQAVSPGTTNLLEGIADMHETFVYLLQQRVGGQNYSYAR